MFQIANILVLSGICMLVVSAFTSQQLIRKLPMGKVRNSWQMLTYIIVGFIFAYAAYMLMLMTGQVNLVSLSIAKIGFTAAAFMLLLCFLTYQITRDIREAIAMDQASIIDPVLDIYNRRYFERRIDEETQRSRRYKLPLSLILFDIDGFNNVKDQHGNLVGDVVLKKVSDFIVNKVRSSDIVARFDEHKIVIGTTQTEEEMAEILADRLREEIADLNVLPNSDTNDAAALQVTVSAGVSTVLDSIKTGFDLVDCAEKALKQAHRQGKNCVSTYDPTGLVEPVGEIAEPAAA